MTPDPTMPLSEEEVAHSCKPRRIDGSLVHSCGGTYQCAHCLRTVGWCNGADDEIERAMGPICDDCAYIETMWLSHADR